MNSSINRMLHHINKHGNRSAIKHKCHNGKSFIFDKEVGFTTSDKDIIAFLTPGMHRQGFSASIIASSNKTDTWTGHL